MIDISSLPDHDFSGLEKDYKAKVLYRVTRMDWVDYQDTGSELLGVFLDHDTAREFVEQMLERSTNYIKSHPDYFDQDYDYYWDEDSNCDEGVSILGKTIDDAKEFCWDYAIEKTPLWYKA